MSTFAVSYNITEMTLLESYFQELIQCVAAGYLFVGIMLMLIKAPKDIVFRPYIRSKRFMSAAFCTMSVNLFAWCFFTKGSWKEFNYHIECADIILFYLEYMLLCYALCNLLNNQYITRKRIVRDMSLWLATSATALIAMLDAMALWREMLMVVALVMLLAYIVRFIYEFRMQYSFSEHAIDNYFSDDQLQFVKWTSNGIMLLFVSWILAIMTMFLNIYFNWLYQFYVISVNLYIATSFVNFVKQYGTIAKATNNVAIADNDADNEPSIPAVHEPAPSEQNALESRLKEWIDAKSYINQQLNIDELAATLGTNKSYLSYYINTTYGTNFSAWISTLRLNEAKTLIISQPNAKLEDIAYSVGFSSPSYFSKVFSAHEGISPTRWRLQQTQI